MQTSYLVFNKEVLDGFGRPLASFQEAGRELEWLPMALHLYISYNELSVSIASKKQHDKVFVILKTNDLRIKLDNIIHDVLLSLNNQKIWLSLVANIVDSKFDIKV